MCVAFYIVKILYILYVYDLFLGDKIENAMGGTWSTDGVVRGMYRVLVGKPVGKRPLRRPRCRWEDVLTHCRPVFFLYIYHKSLIQSKVTFF
jgi:hypothetical protein